MIDWNKLRMMQQLGGTNVGENRDPYGDLFASPPVAPPNLYENLFEPGPMPAAPVTMGLDQLYKEQTEASERFKQLLNDYPEREDPSFGRKITSMLGGLSTLGKNVNNGIDIQDKILEGPNVRRVSDWEKQIRPAEVAATQENQRNVNSRNLAALEIRERLDLRKADETERKNKATEASKAIRDKAYAAKANGYQIKVEGDRVMARNPVTLQSVDLGPSGSMDEFDKVMLQGEQAQLRAETMAEAAAGRAQVAADTAATAGRQVFTDAATGLPKVIDTRNPEGPVQLPVKDATQITRVPGTKGPSQGQDLARVRGMSKSALDLIKKDFLIMADPKNPNSKTTINPKIRLGTGYANWDPRQFAPESPQRAAINSQRRLKDLLTLSLIGEMKEQSKTGATGFGQLTGRELDVLERAATTLDWAQDESTLTEELVRILEKLELIMKPGEGEEGVSVTPKGKLTPADMLRKYGGL